MRIKSLVFMLFGLGLAAGSVVVANTFMNEPVETTIMLEPDMVDVVVARSPIGFGQEVESHHLAVRRWPADSVPEGAFASIGDVRPSDGSEPRRAKTQFFEGEVLLEAKLSRPGEKVTIVQKLGENTRAMAIKVDAVTAVGGFVTPGDAVDIVMTQGRNEDMRTVTILQNIRVIGVDQQAEEQQEAPEVARTITVEVTPAQGQRLALAQKAGTLSLTLRTLDSASHEPLQMIGLRDLLQEEAQLPDAPGPRTVNVRRAGVVELVEIN